MHTRVLDQSIWNMQVPGGQGRECPKMVLCLFLVSFLPLMLVGGCASRTSIYAQAVTAAKEGDIESLLNSRAKLAGGKAGTDSLSTMVSELVQRYYVQRGGEYASDGDIEGAIAEYAAGVRYAPLQESDETEYATLLAVKSLVQNIKSAAHDGESEKYLAHFDSLCVIKDTYDGIAVESYFENTLGTKTFSQSIRYAEVVTQNNDRNVAAGLLGLLPEHRWKKHEVYTEQLVRRKLAGVLVGVCEGIDLRVAEDREYICTLLDSDTSGQHLGEVRTIVQEYTEQQMGRRDISIEELFGVYSLGVQWRVNSESMSRRVQEYFGDRSVGVPAVRLDDSQYADIIAGNIAGGVEPASESVHLDVYDIKSQANVQLSSDQYRHSTYLRGKKTVSNDEYYRLAEMEARAVAEYNSLINNPPPSSNSALGAFAAGMYKGQVDNAIRKVNELRVQLARTPQTKQVDDNVGYQFREMVYQLKGDVRAQIAVSGFGATRVDTLLSVALDKTYVFREGLHPDDNAYSASGSEVMPSEDIALLWMMIKFGEAVKNWYDNLGLVRVSGHIQPLGSSLRIDGDTNKEVYASFYQMALAAVTTASKHYNPGAIPLSVDSEEKKFRDIKSVVEYAKGATFHVLSFNDDFRAASGTAYMVDDEGYLLTNSHVVDGYQYHVVRHNASGNIVSRAYVVAERREEYDLALLKIRNVPSQAHAVSVDYNMQGELGDSVIYVGYPGGPVGASGGEFFGSGVISQVVVDGRGPRFYILDITANQGASGSAIIHQGTGKLIGTLTWGFGRSIGQDELREVLEGGYINIKESQNVCTSAQMIREFLGFAGLQ